MTEGGSAPGRDALTREVKARALALGFARVGIAEAVALEPEGARLRAWIERGRHGSMHWMAETAEVRLDPRHPGMLPGARSVIALAAPYARPEGEPLGPAPGVIARYARGRDYHHVLGKRARRLAAWLRARGYRARASVDAMPVMERAWAQRAGIGFVGKNACLIVPGLGSHVLLAAVITDAELSPDAPMAERCGTCTRCLQACPTRAFEGPRELDARRCISYLTIEHKGPIPEPLRERIGDRWFGCDLCQDVCPFNRTAPPHPVATAPFAADRRWAEHDAASLLAMDEAAFDAFSRGSPVRRAGRAGAARNAAIVLGNAGGRRHLPVLRASAERDPDEAVRDAARWAIARIEARAR
jgi:epoxyqueuosine reductase